MTRVAAVLAGLSPLAALSATGCRAVTAERVGTEYPSRPADFVVAGYLADAAPDSLRRALAGRHLKPSSQLPMDVVTVGHGEIHSADFVGWNEVLRVAEEATRTLGGSAFVLGAKADRLTLLDVVATIRIVRMREPPTR